jgi:hypothetical protein
MVEVIPRILNKIISGFLNAMKKKLRLAIIPRASLGEKYKDMPPNAMPTATAPRSARVSRRNLIENL